MLRSAILFVNCVWALTAGAQNLQRITHSGQLTRQAPFPLEVYKELPNPAPTDASKWTSVKGLQVGWGSTNTRYKKEEPATQLSNKTHMLTAWKGEQVSAQFVVSNNGASAEMSFEVTPLTHSSNPRQKISGDNIFTGFVRYVMTDELAKDRKGGCGYRKAADFDSSLAADPIDHFAKTLTVENKTSQGVWVRVKVPQNAQQGLYRGQVIVKSNDKVVSRLPLNVNVTNRVLPAPSDWKYHLDVWQNPFAVARYYGMKPWSKEHFEKLKIEMQPYVDAGGKVITTSIMHKPWGGQTYDYFETMVTWMKKADNTWAFDFTVFDKWVEFMMELGVTKQINCYSMVPWKLSFQYFDQATNSLKFIETKPGEPQYEEMWLEMLGSFAKHLKQKGWFNKTFISMDERPIKVMLETLKIIRKADKDFKVSLAGSLHEELIDELDDYCVSLNMKYTDEMIQKRKAAGKVTTFYTSCAEPYPNSFTFSNPADNEWYAWYVAKANLDGYLRWAYNSWVLEPLLDGRFVTWAAGDTYFIYPGGRTSMRWEKLKEGIQSFEKIQILRKEFVARNNAAGLRKIDEALKMFDEKNLADTPSHIFTEKAKAIINGL